MPKRASVLNVMIEVQFKEMMHLIGLAHRAQARCQSEKTDAQRAFETLLRRTIEVVGPTFIAEEESEKPS